MGRSLVEITITEEERRYLIFAVQSDLETIENSHELNWMVEKLHAQDILEKLQALDIAHKPID